MIRPLTAADKPHWQRMWAGYCGFYDQPLSAGVDANTWAALLDPARPIHGLVAEREGGPVGFAHYLLHPTTWTLTDACYLEDLYVEPGCRSGGVGRALIDHLLDLCEAHGWSRLYWHTDVDNVPARRLYDSYQEADRFVRYTLPITGQGG